MPSNSRPHKIIDQIGLLLLGVFLCSIISSCEETCYDGKLNNGESALDCGGPCVACDTANGTCFDGILNQGETGIDCGGPCNECITDTTILNPNFICTGTGGTSFFPLSLGSYWIYSMPNNQWFQLEIIEQTTQNNGQQYYHMVTTGAFGTVHDYYRNVSGQILKWNVNLNVDEVYLPSNPVIGQSWTTSSSDSIVVGDIAASLVSQNGCTYDNLLQITSYLGGNASTSYYKRGLGMVQLSSVSAFLDSAVVY